MTCNDVINHLNKQFIDYKFSIYVYYADNKIIQLKPTNIKKVTTWQPIILNTISTDDTNNLDNATVIGIINPFNLVTNINEPFEKYIETLLKLERL